MAATARERERARADKFGRCREAGQNLLAELHRRYEKTSDDVRKQDNKVLAKKLKDAEETYDDMRKQDNKVLAKKLKDAEDACAAMGMKLKDTEDACAAMGKKLKDFGDAHMADELVRVSKRRRMNLLANEGSDHLEVKQTENNGLACYVKKNVFFWKGEVVVEFGDIVTHEDIKSLFPHAEENTMIKYSKVYSKLGDPALPGTYDGHIISMPVMDENLRWFDEKCTDITESVKKSDYWNKTKVVYACNGDGLLQNINSSRNCKDVETEPHNVELHGHWSPSENKPTGIAIRFTEDAKPGKELRADYVWENKL